jgi:hypothetical protein
MIIDAKTVIITLLIIGVGTYFGLSAIRSFALSIAQENHDANLAMDMTEEARRTRREREADEAATIAFAKVEPLLPASVLAKTGTSTTKPKKAVVETKKLPQSAINSATNLQSAPSSGNDLNIEEINITSGDDEAV